MLNVEVTQDVATEMHRLHGRIAELEAERDRYRAVLEMIDSEPFSQFANDSHMLRFVCTAAYNALHP
jgi:hypothetical protein